MEARAQARRSLELDLRNALENEAFELHYQPIFDIRTRRIMSCEALLRWPHPERGMVSPAEFIPVAEEMGLIVEIGEQVLRKACLECRRWPGDTGVAVNLSSIQFSRSNVPALIRETLAATDSPAGPAADRDHRIDAAAGHEQDARRIASACEARRERLARRLRHRLFESQLPAQLPAAQGEDRPVVPAATSARCAPGDTAARHGAAQRGAGTARHRRRGRDPRTSSNCSPPRTASTRFRATCSAGPCRPPICAGCFIPPTWLRSRPPGPQGCTRMWQSVNRYAYVCKVVIAFTMC